MFENPFPRLVQVYTGRSLCSESKLTNNEKTCNAARVFSEDGWDRGSEDAWYFEPSLDCACRIISLTCTPFSSILPPSPLVVLKLMPYSVVSLFCCMVNLVSQGKFQILAAPERGVVGVHLIQSTVEHPKITPGVDPARPTLKGKAISSYYEPLVYTDFSKSLLSMK